MKRGLSLLSLALTIGVMLIIAGAIIMSMDIITCIGGYQNNLKQNIMKDYCLRFLVLFVPIIISALLNVLSFKIFVNLFSFV